MDEKIMRELPLRERAFRRFLHMAFGAVIIYYLFPKTLFGHPAWLYLVVFISLPSIIIELLRVKSRRIFFGLRDHERNHLASYFWFVNGAVILIILFPQYIAAPCILATAIGDPVIGETRPFRRRLAFTIGVLICFLMFVIFRYPLLLAIIASAAAFIAESINIQVSWEFRNELFYSRSKKKVSKYKDWFDFIFRTDDDFMMQIIPAIVIYFAVLFFQANGFASQIPPDGLISTLKELLPFV